MVDRGFGAGAGGDQRFGAQMIPMTEEFAGNGVGGAIQRCSHHVVDEQPDEVVAALIRHLSMV